MKNLTELEGNFFHFFRRGHLEGLFYDNRSISETVMELLALRTPNEGSYSVTELEFMTQN